jgi:hypothetical protein
MVACGEGQIRYGFVYAIIRSNIERSLSKGVTIIPEYRRSRIPRMRDLTIAEQDALIERWRLRNALRTSYPEVIGAMMQWVIDTADIEDFVATGHKVLFSKIPSTDLIARMAVNGYTRQEIEKAAAQKEPPVNWMTTEELLAVVEYVDAMTTYFATHDPGSFAEALEIYEALGKIARAHFFQQNGYLPEQSPVPRVRMTGEDKELKRLKPEPHQPQLFGEGD